MLSCLQKETGELEIFVDPEEITELGDSKNLEGNLIIFKISTSNEKSIQRLRVDSDPPQKGPNATYENTCCQATINSEMYQQLKKTGNTGIRPIAGITKIAIHDISKFDATSERLPSYSQIESDYSYLKLQDEKILSKTLISN